MFFLDSLMIAGIRWTLNTVVAAAEAEMNDDAALRDRLLEAEMQREMGEISEAEFAAVEADLLRAIREIRERRDGGSGAFVVAEPIEAGADGRFQVEAEVAGEFHEVERSDRLEAAVPGQSLPPQAAGPVDVRPRRARRTARARTKRR